MNVKELLEKTRQWIGAGIEKERSNKDPANKFTLTSLNYVVREASASCGADEPTIAGALTALRSITNARATLTHDVFAPHEAIEVIDLALEAL